MKYIGKVLAVLALVAGWTAGAQIRLVEKGRPTARIVVDAADPAAATAGALLQRFVRESSGAELTMVRTAEAVATRPGKYEVWIGCDEREGLSRDGFRLRTEGGVLRISSGGGRGCVYAVTTLLERCLGMVYYAAGTYDLDRRREIVLPAMDCAENPAFRYRQSQAYGMAADSVYRLFLRLEEPKDIFAGNLWVHTFNRLLPADRYGSEHPEYYGFTNGQRRPGRAAQWCLTNDEVFEIVAGRIDSIFKSNPDKTIISVSQNDSNHTFCRCEKCEEINRREGSPAGAYVLFMNRLAERFPDKEISTLAYLFTMKPPKYARPLPNVNIMLCDIDCDREGTLKETPSGREFVEALEGWSKISDNLFIWDYGINFDNMVEPFPNFPILGPNMRLFKKHGATMHFSQIAGSRGGDFSELRSWVVSRLMWNPEQDTDSLMRTFMKGYYGEAAPYLYQYEKLLEGALLASGTRLWIYDSPVTHKNGMLNAACRRRYERLFDKAEGAVADDPALLQRVRMARLPLIYSSLEIARTMPDMEVEKVKADLDLFERYCRDYGVRTLNERNNDPLDYCRLYRERYLPKADRGLARGAKVEWIVAPTGKYRAPGEQALTDGLYGGASFVESWIGWEGTDGAFVVDLGRECAIEEVETDFLHQLGQWILLPRRVVYSTSTDRTVWEPMGETVFGEDQSVPVKFVPATVRLEERRTVRYIKTEVEGVKVCPPWHYGVGQPCWFFIDEITVK